MAKSLVIVESPAKAKTISKYLGKEYIVESSVGHIRELRKKPLQTLKDHLYQKMYRQKKKQDLKQLMIEID